MLVPTRVGMILALATFSTSVLSCPHTRGDDPKRRWNVSKWWDLVPTRVGMILSENATTEFFGSCPHTRGDDPISDTIDDYAAHLSPHAWG